MLKLTRHARNRMRLYGLTKADVAAAIRYGATHQEEDGHIVATLVTASRRVTVVYVVEVPNLVVLAVRP